MELNDFLMHVAMRKPLDTPEIMELLNRMSDEARRITFELNGSYHTMEEIRALMSRLFGRPVDDTFRVFPPFYTDFGKNIHIGKDVRKQFFLGCNYLPHRLPERGLFRPLVCDTNEQPGVSGPHFHFWSNERQLGRGSHR
jgi:hypothetical protein